MNETVDVSKLANQVVEETTHAGWFHPEVDTTVFTPAESRVRYLEYITAVIDMLANPRKETHDQP